MNKKLPPGQHPSLVINIIAQKTKITKPYKHYQSLPTMINNIKNKIYNLLRKSEKWTKTDMVYLAKNGFWLTISKIIGTITALGLAVAYANLLPKDVYATYKYIMSIASLFAITSLPGMETSLMRSVTLGYESSFFAAVKTKLKWSLFGILAGLGLSFYYFFQHNNTLAIGFFIASLSSPFINSLIYGPYLQGKKFFKTISIFNIIKQVVLSSVIITIIWFSPKIITIILSFYLLTLFFQFLFFFITCKKYPPNKKRDKKTISFGKHLSVMGILGTISEQADKILLWHFLGPTELAIYSFATLPITQFQSFLKSIPTIAFPKIVSQDVKTIKKTLPIKVLKFMAILLILVMIYIISAPYIFKFIFPKYLEAIKYSQIFALTLLFFPQRLFVQPIISIANKQKLYIIRTITPLTKIILMLALIPFLGIWGAIYALILSRILLFAFTYFLLKNIKQYE